MTVTLSCKPLAALTAACLASGLISSTAAAVDLSEYAWRAEIDGSFKTGVLYKAVITRDVYDGSLSFPLDVKVVDQTGRVFPSIVWKQDVQDEVTPLLVKVLRSSKRNEEEGYTFSDLYVRPRDEHADVAHNRIIVNVQSRELFRRMEVWGGNDEDNLRLLGTGFLVEQKLPFSIRSRSVDYPVSDARFVQVRILDDPDDGTSFSWNASDVVYAARDDAEEDRLRLEMMDAPAGFKPVENFVTVFLDAGVRNRMLRDLDFELSMRGHDTFLLPVTIFGRNHPDHSWRLLAEGGLFAMGGLHDYHVSVAGFDYRYLKAEFYHEDADAVRVKKATSGITPYHVYFRADSDEKPYLYFGSSMYLLPAQELSSRMNFGVMNEAHPASLSKRRPNPARMADSLEAYRFTMLKLGAGIIVLFGALIVVRVVRRRYL